MVDLLQKEHPKIFAGTGKGIEKVDFGVKKLCILGHSRCEGIALTDYLEHSRTITGP